MLNRILSIICIILSIFVTGGLITINSKINTIASIQSDTIKMVTSYIEHSTKHDAECSTVKSNIIKLESNDKIIENRLQYISDIITTNKMDKTNGK